MGKTPNHMEFVLPSQTLSDCVFHKTMWGWIDTICEAGLNGTCFFPLNMACIAALRRWGTFREPLTKETISLLLHNAPCVKEGAKLIKFCYLDTNQLDALMIHCASCAYDRQFHDTKKSKWIDEAELLQVYRVVDLTCSSINHYVTPVRNWPFCELHKGPPQGVEPYYNDPDHAVRASVPAWINQVAMKLLASEPPILTNGVSTKLLCREYFGPSNLDEGTWQSIKHRTWLCAGQPRPSMWTKQAFEFLIPSNTDKSREEALREKHLGAPQRSGVTLTEGPELPRVAMRDTVCPTEVGSIRLMP